MKRIFSTLFILLFVLLSSLFAACSESGGNIRSLVFSRPGDVALEVGQSDYGGYLLVSAKKKSNFSPEQVEFISEDPAVATVEYKSVALKTYLYYEIIGVGAGETYIYAQSAESGVVSEKIRVTVTAPEEPTETVEPSQSVETPTQTGETPSTADETPTQTGEPTSPDGERVLQIVRLDETVVRGEKTTLSVKGKPGETYKIKVYYTSSVSKASGLEDKAADEDGNVSWTWRVGSSTKPGEHKIVIEGGGESLTLYFKTTE